MGSTDIERLGPVKPIGLRLIRGFRHGYYWEYKARAVVHSVYLHVAARCPAVAPRVGESDRMIPNAQAGFLGERWLCA